MLHNSFKMMFGQRSRTVFHILDIRLGENEKKKKTQTLKRGATRFKMCRCVDPLKE